MSGLEELYGNDAETTAPVAETPAVESVVAPEPQADPSSAPVLETPAQAAPVVSPEPQEHSVPLNVLLRTREEFGGKLTQAEQRYIAAERKLAEIERRRQEAAAQAPDILEDPQGYIEWAERRQREITRREVAAVQAQQAKTVETISRTMMSRHLGPEKFGELEKFIQAAPDQAHAVALKEADPYGWFYEKFEQAQKARKAQDAAKQLESLGGKSLEEVISERVAAALAGQVQQPVAPIATPAAPRNPDGTFAPQPTQRHTPESLAAVNGAAAVYSNGASGSALEELYNN